MTHTFSLKLIFALFLFVFIQTKTLAQDWLWAKRFGNNLRESVSFVKKFPDGNILMAGTFSGIKVGFGSDTLFNTNLQGFFQDIYLVKISPQGNVIWATSLGGINNDEKPYDATFDAENNVYLFGTFKSDSIRIAGSKLILGTTFPSPKTLIAKISTSGQPLWAIRIDHSQDSGNNLLDGFRILPGSNGGFKWVGRCSKRFGIAPDTFLAHPNDYFVEVAYDGNGNYLSGKGLIRSVATSNGGQGTISNPYRISDLGQDNGGNRYYVGNFGKKVVFPEGDSLTNQFYSSASFLEYPSEAHIVKYGPTGQKVWAKSIRGFWQDAATFIAIDQQQNLYVTGWFRSDTLVYQGDALLNTNKTSTTNFYNTFVLKLDSLGNRIWFKKLGGRRSTLPTSLSLNSDQSILITGTYEDTLKVGVFTLLADGSNDKGFLLQLSPTGEAKTLVGINATSDQTANGAIGLGENAILAGTFKTPLLQLGNISLPRAGNSFFEDVFVGRTGIVLDVEYQISKFPNAIKVYPNPTTSFVTVEGSIENAWEVFSSMGRKMNCPVLLQANTRVSEIDLRNVPTGMYLIKSRTSPKLSSRVLVVHP